MLNLYCYFVWLALLKVPICLAATTKDQEYTTAEIIKRLNVWVDLPTAKPSGGNSIFSPVDAMDLDEGNAGVCESVTPDFLPDSSSSSLSDRVVICIIPPIVLDELEANTSDSLTRSRLGLVNIYNKHSNGPQRPGDWFETLIIDTLCLRLFRRTSTLSLVLPFLKESWLKNTQTPAPIEPHIGTFPAFYDESKPLKQFPNAVKEIDELLRGLVYDTKRFPAQFKRVVWQRADPGRVYKAGVSSRSGDIYVPVWSSVSTSTSTSTSSSSSSSSSSTTIPQFTSELKKVQLTFQGKDVNDNNKLGIKTVVEEIKKSNLSSDPMVLVLVARRINGTFECGGRTKKEQRSQPWMATKVCDNEGTILAYQFNPGDLLFYIDHLEEEIPSSDSRGKRKRSKTTADVPDLDIQDGKGKEKEKSKGVRISFKVPDAIQVIILTTDGLKSFFGRLSWRLVEEKEKVQEIIPLPPKASVDLEEHFKTLHLNAEENL